MKRILFVDDEKQLVNSGFFGSAQTITSTQIAISYLGMETIRNLALATDTFRTYVPAACVAPSFCEDMQSHARRTASIIRTFPLPPKLREVAVVSALLHDIGEFAVFLADRLARELAGPQAQAREAPSRKSDDALTEALGLSRSIQNCEERGWKLSTSIIP
jgi:HD-like signal output (HDOD) protein